MVVMYFAILNTAAGGILGDTSQILPLFFPKPLVAPPCAKEGHGF